MSDKDDEMREHVEALRARIEQAKQRLEEQSKEQKPKEK